jgi:hypothetical protein
VTIRVLDEGQTAPSGEGGCGAAGNERLLEINNEVQKMREEAKNRYIRLLEIERELGEIIRGAGEGQAQAPDEQAGAGEYWWQRG